MSTPAPTKSDHERAFPSLARRPHKRKVWLTAIQVDMMLERARATNKRDYLLLQLMRYGLRCGEIVGWRGLPGIGAADIRDQGIWIKGKGYARGIVQDRLVPMPKDLVRQLRSYIADLSAHRSEGSDLNRIFPISEVWAERIVKKYARDCRVDDWELVGPHRLRAFFATDAKDKGVDAFTIRDLMRHKNIATTNLYVGQSSADRLARLVEELATP